MPRTPLRPLARATAALLAAAALAARPAAAQTPVIATGGAPAQLPWLQTFSINPVGIPLGIFSAEYEVALAPAGLTVGVGGTTTANRRLYARDDRWASAKVMYYPGEVSLKDFAVGLSLGVHRAERKRSESAADVKASDAGATLGLLGTYNRLVGREQRLLLGAGAGFRRVLKGVADDSPLHQAYPDGRVVIGIAF